MERTRKKLKVTLTEEQRNRNVRRGRKKKRGKFGVRKKDTKMKRNRTKE